MLAIQLQSAMQKGARVSSPSALSQIIRFCYFSTYEPTSDLLHLAVNEVAFTPDLLWEWRNTLSLLEPALQWVKQSIGEDRAEAQTALALGLYRAGMASSAVTQIKQAIAIAGETRKRLLILALARQKQGEQESAQAAWQQAIDLTVPSNGSWEDQLCINQLREEAKSHLGIP